MADKVFIQSLGCPKNLVDSEVMSGCLRQAGYQLVEEPAEAGIILVNTCGFIQPAVEEGIEVILDLARTKKANPSIKLVVAGCMVQRYGAELRRELPEVDLFLGVDQIETVVTALEKLTVSASFKLDPSVPDYLMNCDTPRVLSTPPFRAYLKATEGCSNRCSYCLIPSLRGPLRSRPLDDLIREARRLEQAGVKELTLIAQDLTAYGLDLGSGRERLNDLLAALLAKTKIPWLRMLYLYPMRLDQAILELVAANERILPYFDIPLQHISNRVLKAMNRPYDRTGVERLLASIREQLPTAAIRTTFLVGFPGEREEDIEELAEFMAAQRLNHVGVFTYCNEEGCEAAKLPDHCPEELKAARKERLMALQAGISLELNGRLVGTTQPVLMEGVSRESDLLLEGRTRFQAPEIDGCVYITAGNGRPGDIVEVEITEAHPYDLVGEMVES
ncbi:MAG: 30S ribosomal protein S12 methylthiotransferase RimO [Desulfurivibrionaceae bacterium]|nr:30S ribosomal protein S12 methylthiotransferase RimO [Desulfobulbales bacterium]MDT8334652.1 30S ribosomal protein S12 methylthiotransferase RimO [Desulfurivibrionaceae bacterium]